MVRARLILAFLNPNIDSDLAARDYVEGMWMMLQQPTPEDFVLATGETHRVREFVDKAFTAAGITLRWVHVPLANFRTVAC